MRQCGVPRKPPYFPPASDLPRAFRAVRVARQLTQGSFDTVSSMAHVSRIERGTSDPTFGKLEALAQVMNVHPVTVLALSYLKRPHPRDLQALFDRVSAEVEALGIEEFSGETLSPGVKPSGK
ncbi:helix-turn-helix transcriptional regulator [Pseudorhodoferax sp. Leaf265]|uniref:helix-turn-helix domain-containing protein n=1 Tax=Pseudorhodoferax sp. Leaf265 TaxID=1736315 RepID=UPI0007C83DBD|nr:helix-turn-helix transcriptional regulator [Pseudorhodoferax sp. Leaf265]